MIGTEIASYRILEKLGEGGMGTVYKAVDTALDRMVAIKVLSSDLSGNSELVQRFKAEAKAQANLNHTNLATLYAFVIQDDRACMVMELVDGETFEQMILRRGPLPVRDALPLFKQALLGIGYAHRAGIVHRDIKPSNLMVNRLGIVKVMDFGIAKVMGARGMTRTGVQLGTGWYMSPEQVLNRPVDIRSDIYSLGVTLYQMITAHVPFDGPSDYQVMTDHVSTPPPLPTSFAPSIPKGVENAVLKALDKNPDARFQTVEEFGTALEQPDTFGMDTQPAAAAPAAAAGSGAYAPRGATVVEKSSAITAPVNVTPIILPRAAAPAADGPGSLPAPAKAPFLTPERKIAASAVAIIILLIGVWAALRPNVKNTGLPAPSDTAVKTQSPPPVMDQPPVSAPASAPAQASSSTAQDPANNGIPALPPVKPETSTPRTAPGSAPPVISQPAAISVPAGTPVTIRLIDNVNSIRDHTGQRFAATVDAPVMVRGRTMIAPGAGARVVLTVYGPEVILELVSISVNGANHVVRSNQFEKKGMVNGKPSPLVTIPSSTRIVFTLRTPIT